MASVFAMQPIGQIAGNLVSLVVVAICKKQGTGNLVHTVDMMWRWVIGLGVIPGVLALAFRFAIPETPRFLLEIEDDPIKAEFDATPLFDDESAGGSMSMATESPRAGEFTDFGGSNTTYSMEEIVLPAPAMPASRPSIGTDSSQAHWTVAPNAPPITLNSPWTLSRKDIKQYFWTEGNWRTLFATAMTWVSFHIDLERFC